MRIEKIWSGALGNNSYLITDEREKVSALIDVGEVNQRVFYAIKAHDIAYVLLTHCHYDHSGGTQSIKDVTNAKIAIHKDEADGLLDPDINLSCAFKQREISIKPDVLLEDGQEISVGSLKIKVIHTPGHTRGSVCFLVGKTLFSGDTLFRQNVGRIDLPTGDPVKMKESLLKIKELDSEIKILPGHGEPTILSDEKETNPYLNGTSYDFIY